MSVNKRATETQYNKGDYNTININNPVVGNLAEFRKNGYIFGGCTWQRGYIRRALERDEDRPVYVVTRGKRKGDVFILQPSYISTRFCKRIYLVQTN